MSYCRWSSDDFRCDLYIYESAAGFVIHVAANRVEWDPPTSPYKLEKLQLPHEKARHLRRVSKSPGGRTASSHRAAL